MSADKSLICVIVNEGFTELVMDAARRVGAKGGTTINARGTGNIEMEKFYGIDVKPNKEIVLIVCNNEIKESIMSEIYKSAGLETQGNGFIFSLPVEDMVVRKTLLKDEEKSKE